MRGVRHRKKQLHNSNRARKFCDSTVRPPHRGNFVDLDHKNDSAHDDRGESGSGDEVEVGCEQTQRQHHHHTCRHVILILNNECITGRHRNTHLCRAQKADSARRWRCSLRCGRKSPSAALSPPPNRPGCTNPEQSSPASRPKFCHLLKYKINLFKKY